MRKDSVQQRLFPEVEEGLEPEPSGGKPEVVILDIVSGFEDHSLECILSEAVARKIQRRDALRILEKLGLAGIVYYPKHGEYKVV